MGHFLPLEQAHYNRIIWKRHNVRAFRFVLALQCLKVFTTLPKEMKRQID